MKKYLLGLIAVLMALGFSAFTKPVHKVTTYYFFPYSSGYESLIYHTSTQTPPTATLCPGTHTNQCDGGVLTSDATQVFTAPNTWTWTINSGATIQVKDYHN